MITVLMGAPAAGKTTWVQKNKTGFEHIYSTELVRLDRSAAKGGKDIIADGTHTIGHHRGFWLAIAKRLEIESHLIVFDTALPVLIAGNRMRSHPCPDDVLLKHHKRMQIAKRIVDREPWDSVQRLVR